MRITSQFALIGIQTTLGKMEIQQPKAEMHFNTEHAKVEIHSEQIQVQIDQTIPFAEAGLKSPMDESRDLAAFSRQQAMEAIAHISRQGDELGAIENKTNPVPDQAIENAFERIQVETNIDLIPKTRPKIDFIGGNVDIQVKEGNPNLRIEVNKPIVHIEKNKVEAYLRQRNSIQIEYVGKELDLSIK